MKFFATFLVLATIATLVSCAPSGSPMCPTLDIEQILTPVEGLENTYRLSIINHDSQLNPDWIDLHMKVNEREQNIRLVTAMSSKQVVQDGIVVMPNEMLRYYATYSVNGVSCDTPTYEYQATGNQNGINNNNDINNGAFGANTRYQQQAAPLRTASRGASAPLSRNGIYPSATSRYFPASSYDVQASPLRRWIRDARTNIITPASQVSAKACPIIATEQIVTASSQPNTYKLTFVNYDAQADPEWVDLHLQVQGKEETNLRLVSNMQGKEATQDGITLLPGEVLRYSATYRVNGMSCDTPVYEFQAQNGAANGYNGAQNGASFARVGTAATPRNQQYRRDERSMYGARGDFSVSAPNYNGANGAACPAIDADTVLTKESNLENTYSLTFLNNDMSGAKPDFVDIHLQVEGKEQMNIRLVTAMSSPQVTQNGIVLLPGETIHYSATYGVNGITCETIPQQFTANSEAGFGTGAWNTASTGAPSQSRFANTRYGATNTRNLATPVNTNNNYGDRYGSEYETFAAPARRVYGGIPQRPFQLGITEIGPACPSIVFDQKVEPMTGGMNNAFQLSFVPQTENLPFDYVDLHYQVNDEPLQNIRLGSGTARIMEKTGLMIAPGSTLKYSFTYSLNDQACDTEMFQLTTPASTAYGMGALYPATPVRAFPSAPQPQVAAYHRAQRFAQPIQAPVRSQYQPTLQQPSKLLAREWTPMEQWPATGATEYGYQQPIQQPIQSAARRNGYGSIIQPANVAAWGVNPYDRVNVNMRVPAMQQPVRSSAPFSYGPNTANAVCPSLQFAQKVEKELNNPNIYIISFIDRDDISNVESVDLHYKIDNAEEINARLTPNILASTGNEHVYSQSGIFMQPGQNLRFYFTYLANGVACESPRYGAQAF